MQNSFAVAISGAQAQLQLPHADPAPPNTTTFGFANSSNAAQINCSPIAVNALRVLIVEDEVLIGMLLSDLIEELGFEVCAVEATEAGAVAAALRWQPQLMIVDARLREGSGIKAVEQIIGAGFVPHIFVSGDKLVAASLHPQAIILQKPFLEAGLTAAIGQALGRAIG